MRNFVILGIAAFLTGCIPVKPTEPTPSPTDLRYDTKHTLVYDKDTLEFRSSFSGSRCYSTTSGGTSTTHMFTFDDEIDTVTVSVNDVGGLFPGDSFGYVLQHIDPATSSTIQSWRLELKNPDSATKKLHYFDFKISTASSLKWKAGTQIKGIYKFGQTNRPLAVDVEFKVGNTVSMLTACDPND